MKLLEFLNTYPDNWLTLLGQEPYYLKISIDQIGDEEYYMFKYNMIMSNFNLDEVKEARGCIVRYNPNSEQYEYVCRPFDKFFNYGEPCAETPNINWESVSVQEKIDGSLIKVWFDQNSWHISTNGTIDAFKAECGNTTFGNVFTSILGADKINEFFSQLNPHFTYMFELVAPAYNHIVVRYFENKIYFLGLRENDTGKEHRIDKNFARKWGLAVPKIFKYRSLAECINAAHQMGINEEGYVVCDNNFRRIKIKGDEYLRLHKLRGNGPLTTLRVIEMWQNDSLDDFLAYYPEYAQFIGSITKEIRNLIDISEIAFHSLKGIEEQKDYALQVKTYVTPIQSYLFARKKNKTSNALDFFQRFRARSLSSYIMSKIEINIIGVNDDGE